MKQNRGPIEVEFNPNLKKILKKLFSYKGNVKKPIGAVIESGSYLGTGSTRELAEVIIESKKDDSILFYTLEAKPENFKVAKENLAKYPFIQALYGLSLNLEECLDFIKDDPAVYNHQDYPDLFIDCIKDPVYMYRTEIWGCYSGNSNPPVEGLFYTLLPQFKDQHPLVVLDSAGGIGLLEFTRTRELMENNHYYLLCDDKLHLKHFRTYEYIKGNKSWKLLCEDDRVFLAEFLGE